MNIDFKTISPYEQRLRLFEDSDIVSRIDKAKASVLSPKAKDCQRQLNEASSVWAVDGKRFLVIFSNETDADSRQKASIWAMKAPGCYQRIKTVWVGCHDYIFEAVAVFLIEYFELFILTNTYSSDVLMLVDIEDKIKEAVRYTPSHLKQKIKLLKAWDEIMPKFNDLVDQLDRRIYDSIRATDKGKPAKPSMKTFLQLKAPVYCEGCNFTVAPRKECVEYYVKLQTKGHHAVANMELFGNTVNLMVSCRNFTDELIDKVLPKGIDLRKYPVLMGLMDSESKYHLQTIKGKGRSEAVICREIKKEFPNWLEAIGNREIVTEIRELIHCSLDLYNELLKASDSEIRELAKNFYD